VVRGLAAGTALQYRGWMDDLPQKVADLMTRKVVTIGEDDTLEAAESGMQRFRFRHLPVVKDGKLLGLVSHRDLLRATASYLVKQADAENREIHKLPAKVIMQSEVVSVRPDEPLLDAARLMWESKLGCLPVTDEAQQLVGILTEADFIKLAIHWLGDGTPPPPPGSFGPR
jgi:CBS domain-containing protein